MDRLELAKALFLEGLDFFRNGRYESAERKLKEAHLLVPERVSVLTNLAAALLKQGKIPEARTYAGKSVELDGANAEGWLNLAACLEQERNFQEALAGYDKAISIAEGYAEAWCNRGNALHELGRHDEALESYERAIALESNHAEAWYNRGIVLASIKRHAEALESYAKARAIKPDYIEAEWNESLARLTLGEFEPGWRKYECRWRRKGAAPVRHAQAPLWDGREPLLQKRILAWHEQGYGDTLQFCRYAPMLAALGADVVLEVQKPLAGLLRSLPGGVQVLESGGHLPPFDYQIPLLSLPLALNTNARTIPASVPYLEADARKAEIWNSRLARENDAPKIGLACSGNASHINDKNRSMPIEKIAPLLGKANFYLLQKELRENEKAFLESNPRLRYLGGEIADFSDTAAIVANLDLVIGVDTSLVHLAGALGKPVWILLPWAPEWRWLLDRSDSPWYPSARLFRQDGLGDWEGVIERLDKALVLFSEERSGSGKS